MRFEEHLEQLKKTYEIMMSSMHEMHDKILELIEKNEKLVEKIQALEEEAKDE